MEPVYGFGGRIWKKCNKTNGQKNVHMVLQAIFFCSFTLISPSNDLHLHPVEKNRSPTATPNAFIIEFGHVRNGSRFERVAELLCILFVLVDKKRWNCLV